MTNNVNFDALARRANESGGAMEDLNNLFGAAFALEKWHFIARGELPNVIPFIASNAAYAGGQQMVRAFTDTDRLMRFATENHLTDEAGSASMLSLPTATIIDYLEQFTAHGVHGIWFNSDAQSDGFFLPLAQLRPVREHLTKINWQAPIAAESADSTEPAIETLLVVVKDGLMFPSGFVSNASYTCNFFCRVPAGWTEGEGLKPEYLEKLYQRVYGANWRMGNDDGSRYVVLDSFAKIFPPETVKTTVWRGTENTSDSHFWFYIGEENGEIKNVTAEEFQADVDAAFQTS